MKTQDCTVIAILGLSASQKSQNLAKYGSLKISLVICFLAEVYGGPKDSLPTISTVFHDAIEVSEVYIYEQIFFDSCGWSIILNLIDQVAF